MSDTNEMLTHPVEACRSLSPACFNNLVRSFVDVGVLYYIDMNKDTPLRLTDPDDGVWYILSWSNKHKNTVDIALNRCLPLQSLRLRVDRNKFVIVQLDDTEMLELIEGANKNMGVVFAYNEKAGLDYYFRPLADNALREMRSHQYWEIASRDPDYWNSLVLTGYMLNL